MYFFLPLTVDEAGLVLHCMVYSNVYVLFMLQDNSPAMF